MPRYKKRLGSNPSVSTKQMMKPFYYLRVSPSIFRETYYDKRIFEHYIFAWFAAWRITEDNPYSEVIICKG